MRRTKFQPVSKYAMYNGVAYSSTTWPVPAGKPIRLRRVRRAWAFTQVRPGGTEKFWVSGRGKDLPHRWSRRSMHGGNPC